ncbi:MAG: peptidylprolyl isomerase [Sphingomonadaceae bacterium]
MFRSVFALFLLLIAVPAAAREPATARVRLETSMGPIVIEVDLRRAPITAKNFLAYADQKRFDGTSFYRAARYKSAQHYGLVQGGIDHTISRALVPIAHEPTSKTGLKHLDGTVSMARNRPGTAMGDFFICVGVCTYLDAGPNGQPPGYAAFGRVVSGMEIVRKILALPTYKGGYSRTTMGQSIIDRVKIVSARRLPD